MISTPFPTTPLDVAPLSSDEFLFELELTDFPSLDVVCQRFGDDGNRALIWFIRFRALRTFCVSADMTEWLDPGDGIPRDVWEVAAYFELNDAWEFDVPGFCAEVSDLIRQRPERRANGY